jgi:hypothetical protein
MEEIRDFIRRIATDFGGVMPMLGWFGILFGILALWAMYKMYVLTQLRKRDSDAMMQLARFQRKAIASDDMTAEEKISGYFGILYADPKDRIHLMYYKYLISHRDFSDIITGFNYRDYRRVTTRRRTWLISDLILLAVVWLAYVNIGVETGFRDISVMAAMNSLMIPGIIVFAQVGIAVILYLYCRSIAKYKSDLIKQLQESMSTFFNPLEPHYEYIALYVAKKSNPSRSRYDKIRALIRKDGGVFRREFSLVNVQKRKLSEVEIRSMGEAVAFQIKLGSNMYPADAPVKQSESVAEIVTEERQEVASAVAEIAEPIAEVVQEADIQQEDVGDEVVLVQAEVVQEEVPVVAESLVLTEDAQVRQELLSENTEQEVVDLGQEIEQEQVQEAAYHKIEILQETKVEEAVQSEVVRGVPAAPHIRTISRPEFEGACEAGHETVVSDDGKNVAARGKKKSTKELSPVEQARMREQVMEAMQQLTSGSGNTAAKTEQQTPRPMVKGFSKTTKSSMKKG